jgi:hypothetical protein
VDIGYGKVSLHEDIVHALQAIVESLGDELQLPDVEKRQQFIRPIWSQLITSLFMNEMR